MTSVNWDLDGWVVTIDLVLDLGNHLLDMVWIRQDLKPSETLILEHFLVIRLLAAQNQLGNLLFVTKLHDWLVRRRNQRLVLECCELGVRLQFEPHVLHFVDLRSLCHGIDSVLKALAI